MDPAAMDTLVQFRQEQLAKHFKEQDLPLAQVCLQRSDSNHSILLKRSDSSESERHTDYRWRRPVTSSTSCGCSASTRGSCTSFLPPHPHTLAGTHNQQLGVSMPSAVKLGC